MRLENYLVALLITFTSCSLSAAGIQRWVDEDGNVHYGDQSPAGAATNEIQVDPAPGGSGLRPGEMERLRKIESRDDYDRRVRDSRADRDRHYKEVQKRDDKLFRCRDLDRKYSSGYHKKSVIVTQKRRLGCP